LNTRAQRLRDRQLIGLLEAANAKRSTGGLSDVFQFAPNARFRARIWRPYRYVSLKHLHSSGKAIFLFIAPATAFAVVWWLFPTLGRGCLASQRPFSCESDWYSPAPLKLLARSQGGVQIPSRLIRPVNASLRQEAKSLLRTKKVLDLTEQQAKRLAGGIDPNAALRQLIEEHSKRLHFFEDEGVLAAIKGMSSRQREERRLRNRTYANDEQAEIDQYSKWLYHLKPYLLRGVALERAEGHFNGYLVHDRFMVAYLSIGTTPLAMTDEPLVVYLPRKPGEVYNDVGMMR
jgi:hypothetical protein